MTLPIASEFDILFFCIHIPKPKVAFAVFQFLVGIYFLVPNGFPGPPT